MNDYHLHLHPHGPYTGDGPPLGEYPDGLIESYVETASAQGVEDLCFTEHLYRCVESEPALGRFWEDEPLADLAEQTERFIADDRTLSLEAYVDAVVSAKDRGLPVKLGLEVDFFPETIDAVLALIEPYPWDLLIGSVHWLGGWSLDHPEVVHEFTRRGVRRAYEDYFSAETVLAESGAVDVLAHIDLIKVFGHRLDQAPLDLYQPVVEGAARTGTAVEINTAGASGLAGEAYPSPQLLKMLHDGGVSITFGSDAHRPEDVGRGFGRARTLAFEAGYTHHLRFESRIGESIEL